MFPSPAEANKHLQTLRNHAGSGKERLKLFNELCKTCSRERVLPRSMHIPDRIWEPIGDDRYGGQATVSQCIYEGRRVAVKVPYLNLINLDNILRVSIPPAHTLRRLNK